MPRFKPSSGNLASTLEMPGVTEMSTAWGPAPKSGSAKVLPPTELSTTNIEEPASNPSALPDNASMDESCSTTPAGCDSSTRPFSFSTTTRSLRAIDSSTTPGMPLSKDDHKNYPIWITLFNIPVDFWTPLGLSWIASWIGKPLLLDSNTARMEQMQYARVCVEVVGGGPLPTKVRLNCGQESDAGSARVVEVGVKYHWKPPRCASCKKSGHSVAQCKAKTLSMPTGESKSMSDSYPSAVDVAPGGPLEDENGKRLLAKGYNTATSAGKPSGFQKEGIDAPGEVRRLENMMAPSPSPSPSGCSVSTIMQTLPAECKSPSVLQDPGVADVQLSNAMIQLDNQNLGGADGLISSQVTKLARSDDKSCQPAHSDSGAAVVPCSNHDPALSGLAEHHQLDDLLPDDAGLEMTLAVDPPPSSIIAPSAQDGQVHCCVSVDPDGDLDLTPSSITRISNKYLQDASDIDREGGAQDVSWKEQFQPESGDLASSPSNLSDLTEEFETGVDVSHEPMYHALHLFMNVEDSLKYFESFTPEHRHIVRDFIGSCWDTVTEETKKEFRASYPSVVVDQNVSDAIIEALRMLVAATPSQPHLESLSSDGKKVVFGFLSTLLKMRTAFLTHRFRDLDELVGGLDGSKSSSKMTDRRVKVVNHNQLSSLQDGTWKQAKSRSRQKSASKISKGTSVSIA